MYPCYRSRLETTLPPHAASSKSVEQIVLPTTATSLIHKSLTSLVPMLGAIQNAQTMYKCLKASLMNSLQSTVFLQLRNLPAHEDGFALWKKLTDFTSVASLQLSNLTSCQILEFNHEMHINSMCLLSTPRSSIYLPWQCLHTVPSPKDECIQHLLCTYAIKLNSLNNRHSVYTFKKTNLKRGHSHVRIHTKSV